MTADQVFHQHGSRIYRLAQRLLANPTDAEDVTQDVLLQVVRKLGTFRYEAELSTWLHRVTLNAALRYRRKCARRPEQQMPDGPEPLLDQGLHAGAGHPSCPPPEEQAINGELHQLLEKAIASLPPVSRDVFVLAQVEGLPNAEIGELLGLNLGTVKTRLHRARLMLREILAPHLQAHGR